MHFITLTSDYGFSSTYASALKGAIYQSISQVQVIDINNNIQPFNIIQAAFVLKNNWFYFPEKTIHFICVDTNIGSNNNVLIAKKNNHYFIGVDNGIFSLMFDEYDEIYKINTNNETRNLFVELELFIPAAGNIFNNVALDKMYEKSTIANKKQNQMPIINNNVLSGSVMFIDGYGNALTNINKDLFYNFVNNSEFKIFYRPRYTINEIRNGYFFKENGEEIALFNSNNLLQFSVNQGSASQLLGLKFGSPILIEKYDK
ncbi:MAG: S-adenosyl-l-methionine hydroxide adenosyltransferase family protein [Bacteroidia bacterium]